MKTEEELLEIVNKKGWYETVRCNDVTEDFIRKYHENFDIDCWDAVSDRNDLSLSFVEEFYDKVDWLSIQDKWYITEEILRKYIDYVYWDWLNYNKVSEDFIREFKDKVDWSLVSERNNLSLGFIREFKDDLDWIWVLNGYENIDDNFVDEFKDYFKNWDSIVSDPKVSDETIYKYRRLINWEWLYGECQYYKLSSRSLLVQRINKYYKRLEY